MIYIHPSALDEKHLRLLVESINAADPHNRHNPSEMLARLHSGAACAFNVDGGLMVLEVETGQDNSRRLVISAFAGCSLLRNRRRLVNDLRRVAAEWRCDMIQTIAWSIPLARAICKVGGMVESVTVTLGVEG